MIPVDFVYTLWMFAIGFFAGGMAVSWFERQAAAHRARDQFVDECARMELILSELCQVALVSKETNGDLSVQFGKGRFKLTLSKRQLARL